MNKTSKGLVRSAAIIGGLAALYSITSPSPEQLQNKKDYPLPEKITVVETSLPYKTEEKIYFSKASDGTLEKRVAYEKTVKTSDIDFSKDFTLKTDRYRFIKDKDWLISRIIGHVVAMPGRLLFWDWDYAWGQDAQRTRASLSMLQNDTTLKDITLRLNHNEALSDMVRMFTDKKLKERNGLFGRIVVGIPTSIGNELWAELSRGSYYNPLTRTAVCYSNIESITAHEIGHYKDFNRFDSDWGYMLSRVFPPSMLYQEGRASLNADKLTSDDDKNQLYRYLLPAFLTYLLTGYAMSKKTLQKQALEHNGKDKKLEKFDKLKESEKPRIYSAQTMRHFITLNLDLYAGIAAYQYLDSMNAPEPVKYIGFAVGMIITQNVADNMMKKIKPYNHEQPKIDYHNKSNRYSRYFRK